MTSTYFQLFVAGQSLHLENRHKINVKRENFTIYESNQQKCNLETHPTSSSKRKSQVRQIYENNFFANLNEKHEVANHYRDFKMMRRKIATNQRKCCRRANKKFNLRFREVLQIPCIVYPRSSDAVPQRGRNNECIRGLPDECYDPTIRRINAAKSLNDFKSLINGLKYFQNLPKSLIPATNDPLSNEKYQWRKKITPLRTLTKNQFQNISSEANNTQNYSCFKNLGEQRTRNFYRGNLSDTAFGFLQTLDAVDGEAKQKICTEKRHQDDWIIKLASECFDEGFQSHLRYVESIGQRSSLESVKHKQSTCNVINSFAATNTAIGSPSQHSRPSSGYHRSTLASGRNLRFFTTTQQIVHSNRRNLRPQNNNFGINKKYRQSHEIRQIDENFPPKFVAHRIRVDITRSTPSKENVNTPPTATVNRVKEGAHPALTDKPIFQEHKSRIDIMNNFLINNSVNDTQATNYKNNSETRNSVGKLIDNFCDLQIAEFCNIPKIVLTDFSTSQETINVAKTFLVQTQSSEHNDVKNELIDNFDNCRSLGIQNESNYHSEARPP